VGGTKLNISTQGNNVVKALLLFGERGTCLFSEELLFCLYNTNFKNSSGKCQCWGNQEVSVSFGVFLANMVIFYLHFCLCREVGISSN
jgi:hypothetical protein